MFRIAILHAILTGIEEMGEEAMVALSKYMKKQLVELEIFINEQQNEIKQLRADREYLTDAVKRAEARERIPPAYSSNDHYY